MPSSAHLLLQTDVGRADEVAAFVAALPGVVQTAVTSGPYDVIAVLAADDVGQVLHRARQAPGLWGLHLCRPAGQAG